MDKKALKYIFEYNLKLPVSHKCDYCNHENELIHLITKKHKEIIMVEKDKDEYIFSDEEKDKIFNVLETKANKELLLLEEMLNSNKASLIKDNKCKNCKRVATFSLNQAFKAKIILQAIIYIIVVLLSLGLNAIMQQLMLALLNNENSFFTSIFFYPSVFFVVCSIFYIFDIKKIKKELYNDLPNDLSYPTLNKDKKEISKSIYIDLN